MWIYVGSDDLLRVEPFDTHRNNLFFQTHLNTMKRRRLGSGKFNFYLCKARVTFYKVKDGINAVGVPGNRAVDTFGCQQYRAVDSISTAYL